MEVALREASMTAPHLRARGGDVATIVAVALVAYALSNLAHEGLAHGGACLAAGGRAEMLNAVFFDCDKSAVSPAGVRGIAAAGSLVNLALAAAAFALLARRRRAAPPAAGAYFFWLLGTINLLQATGYWLFSGLGGIGDWAVVVRGFEPQALWRAGLALAGGAGYVAAIAVALRTLSPMLGRGPGRVALALRLTVVPYLAGGALYVAAGLFNPLGWLLVLISAAAASLGGTSALAWMAQLLRNERRWPPHPGPALELARRPGWLVAGAATAALFVAVLGPGIRF